VGLRSALAGSQSRRAGEEVATSTGPTAGPPVGPTGEPLLSATGLHVRYGRTHALRGIDLTVAPGEVVAVMGRNGAGKSSLLWALQGSGPRSAGSVRVGPETGSTAPAADPASLRPREARRRVALVPQNPQDLLYLTTVGQECAAADLQAAAAPGSTRALLDRLAGTDALDDAAHPRDLSEGQRLTLVLAIQLVARPRLLLLDEPTRGLDYATKRRLTATLAEHAAAGGAVLLSSHDVEFVAECARRVVVLADGEVVTDADVHQVLAASPVFAPQVAKILHPLELLTVAAVRAALAVPA
jgi:energy-coupling factor transport system ATP-binding protein